MAALASDWLRQFCTSPLKMLNGIQQNLTGSKISTSFNMFVLFGPIIKQKWPLWPIPRKRWHIVLRCTICGPLGLLFMRSLFSGERQWPFGPLVSFVSYSVGSKLLSFKLSIYMRCLLQNTIRYWQ